MRDDRDPHGDGEPPAGEGVVLIALLASAAALYLLAWLVAGSLHPPLSVTPCRARGSAADPHDRTVNAPRLAAPALGHPHDPGRRRVGGADEGARRSTNRTGAWPSGRALHIMAQRAPTTRRSPSRPRA